MEYIVRRAIPNHHVKDNERLEHHLGQLFVSSACPHDCKGRTDDRVWLSKARGKGFADIMDGAIF